MRKLNIPGKQWGEQRNRDWNSNGMFRKLRRMFPLVPKIKLERRELHHKKVFYVSLRVDSLIVTIEGL